MSTEQIQPEFTKEELEEIRIFSDPVLWSEKYLRDPKNPNHPLVLRWYQKEILNSRRRKKIIRAGRRSGKTISLICEILWKMFTRQYRRVVLITPYKSQVSEIWDVLEKMVENSPEINNSIKRKINNPQELELYNGSHLKCFTAGSKSSSKGTNVRSVSADDLYLDEADYLGESALEAIEPLLLSSPDTTLWVSSTPTGKRETFWKWATKSKELDFDAFHYPASVSPYWISIEDAKKKGIPLNQSQEYYYKSSKSESFYTHEILAEFGEEEEGVFKNIFLDDSIYDFGETIENATLHEYNPNFSQNNKNTYIMGVDWNNSVNGTQIVITEYLNELTKIIYYEEANKKKIKKDMKIKDKFRLFYRVSLSSTEDSQLSSVRKIIDLINKYKIDHIYCDLGFGTTNIELLREYGLQHKEFGLDKKIVPIDFGSNVEMYDPLLKTLEKKPMKPFVVYTAVNEIEKGNYLLPLVEDDDGRLISQIRNYSVKKHGQSGVPIFSQGKDHILIAWLLSVFGFHKEYGTLINPGSNLDDCKIYRVNGANKLQPFLNNLDRRTLKESGTTSTLFNETQGIKSMFGLDKVTMDPRFFRDKETPESYIPSPMGKNPWSNQIAKIGYMNINRNKVHNNRNSPSGRKLI